MAGIERDNPALKGVLPGDLDVVDVKPRGGYRSWLRFQDGTEGEIDLATRSWTGKFFEQS